MTPLDVAVEPTLLPEDDLLVHSQLDPVSAMWTDDPRCYERYWFNLHDRAGDLMIVQGAGFYPNLGTADSFAIVVHRGIHTSIRVAERRTNGRMSLHFGPIGAEVLGGLDEWHLTLDDSDHGISYDLKWKDSKVPKYQRIGPVNSDGRILFALAGFESFGSGAGWVEVDGERIELEGETFRGSRDRHWGVRNGVGGRHHFVEDKDGSGNRFFQQYFPGQYFELDSYGVWANRLLPDRSDPERKLPEIVGFDRRFAFDSGSQLVLRGEITNTMDDGTTLDVSFERLNNQIAFLRVGGYGSAAGGTPGTDHWMGVDLGGTHIERQRFDLNAAEVRSALSGVNEHQVRVVCGSESAVGLIEAHEPQIYEMCASGAKGYGFL